MPREKAGHFHGVARVTVHAQFQRLQALQKQKGIEWAQGGAKVTQSLHASLHDVGKVAERFVEADAVIALARLQHLREGTAIPGESAAIDNHAADRCSMPADELGGRM